MLFGDAKESLSMQCSKVCKANSSATFGMRNIKAFPIAFSIRGRVSSKNKSDAAGISFLSHGDCIDSANYTDTFASLKLSSSSLACGPSLIFKSCTEQDPARCAVSEQCAQCR